MLNATLFTTKKCDEVRIILTGIPQQKIIVNDGFKTQPFKGSIGYGGKIRQIFHSGKVSMLYFSEVKIVFCLMFGISVISLTNGEVNGII